MAGHSIIKITKTKTIMIMMMMMLIIMMIMIIIMVMTKITRWTIRELKKKKAKEIRHHTRARIRRVREHSPIYEAFVAILEILIP